MNLTITEEVLTVEVVSAGTLLITEEPAPSVSVPELGQVIVQELVPTISVQELHDVVVATEEVAVIVEMGIAGPQGPPGPPGPGVDDFHIVDVLANRPVSAEPGSFFIATDVDEVYVYKE